ncbi:MAG: hypothetical protein NTU88_08990, partial [Armatimonadetes bacterium]|nr:hypothetical protein [Armatimonadota bacterium]
KQGGFHVIALRDVLPYLPEKPVGDDPMLRTQYPACAANELYWPTEVEQTTENLNGWLPNMVRHGYSLDEMVQVTALPKERVADLISRLPASAPSATPDSDILLLPYPGGRHPRIGFLEGAIDPLRGTKVSIFPPWQDGGYVVLDIPEAIFSNLGLTFLAHTHIPTIWNDQNKEVENRDWIIEKGGGLRSEWRLDNGIAFGASVSPKGRDAVLELWLENGTEAALTGLRTQICLMLKGAPGFDEQNNHRKRFEAPTDGSCSRSSTAAARGATSDAPASIPIPCCPMPRLELVSRCAAGFDFARVAISRAKRNVFSWKFLPRLHSKLLVE